MTSKPPPHPDRRLTTRLFFAAVVLHGLAYLLLLPPWMGEDEPWHLEYAHHVAEGYRPWGGRTLSAAMIAEMPFSQLQVQRRFAEMPAEVVQRTQVDLLRSMERANFWERIDWLPRSHEPTSFDQVEMYFTATTQPPLYYLVTGGWLALFGDRGPEARLWLARILSLACYVATVALTLAFARMVFDDERFALAAALVVAWLPMHARQAGVVNNDVLAKTIGALVLWLGARYTTGRGGGRELAAMVVVSGLGIALVKSTVAGAAGVALVALAAGPVMRDKRRARLLALGILAALAGGVAFLFAQGSPAVPHSVDDFWIRLARAFNAQAVRDIGRTSVGAFNWYSRSLPGWVYSTFWAATAAAVVGAVFAVARGGDRLRARAPLVLAVSAILFQLLLILLRGVPVGRYLAPAAPAFGTLAALGVLGPLPARWRPVAFLGVATFLLVLDAVFLLGGLLPNQYLVWGD